ncbi:MAG: VTT domain-containing protein [Candidatus Magasanikbacteria bacterium]|nr:VTT domain-containing protein [Candidatus Magasanikbacteria bacterium]
MSETLLNILFHADTYLATFITQFGNVVYVLLFGIIFMETGFVLTPFLPGDSLIFVSGTFAASGSLNPYLLFILLASAAILGDTVNYWVGHYFGEKIFVRFIKQEHLEKTKLFFEHHGKKTIVLARFMPIVRTIAPFVAGMGNMNYMTFLSYNIIGGITWVGIFVFAGYFFGNLTVVQDNLTLIVFLIIGVSCIPAIIEYIKHKRKK